MLCESLARDRPSKISFASSSGIGYFGSENSGDPGNKSPHSRHKQGWHILVKVFAFYMYWLGHLELNSPQDLVEISFVLWDR